MDSYFRVFFYSVFILYGVFHHFGITDVRAATTVSTSPTTTNKNGTQPPGKLLSRATPKIVNVKSGTDGSTSDQECKCELFYVCSTENTVLEPQNGETCETNYVFCCTPNTVAGGTPTDENTKNDPSTSTTSTTEISAMDCQCVSADRCERTLEDQVSGADAIDVKKSWCGTSAICCPFDKIINSTTDGNPSPSTSTNPSVETSSTADPNQGNGPSTSEGTTISTEDCQCISADRCRQSTEDPAVSGAGLIDEKNKAKCSASQVCCTSGNIINEGSSTSTESTGGSPVDSNSDCGLRNTGSQDIFNNSKDTSFGEFPWMALLVLTKINSTTGESSEVIIGGASLVSSKVVLTAAHRLRDVSDMKALKVRVGEYDTTVGNDKEQKPHQERQVFKITQHPKFNSKPHYNNLALLEVAEPFTLDYHIRPICIPSTMKTYEYDPSNCVATGWGKITFGPEAPHSATLKKVGLTIVPNDICQEELRKTRLGKRFELHSSFICAKSRDGMDTCECDGGGPLVCPLRSNPNQYVQVGIVSWGIGCNNDLPGVYASLEKNLIWLSQVSSAAGVFSSSSTSSRKKVAQ